VTRPLTPSIARKEPQTACTLWNDGPESSGYIVGILVTSNRTPVASSASFHGCLFIQRTCKCNPLPSALSMARCPRFSCANPACRSEVKDRHIANDCWRAIPHGPRSFHAQPARSALALEPLSRPGAPPSSFSTPPRCFTAIIKKCTSHQKIAFGRFHLWRHAPTSIGSAGRPIRLKTGRTLGLQRRRRPMKRSPQQILRLDAHHGAA
jgi:hypothetical protein